MHSLWYCELEAKNAESFIPVHESWFNDEYERQLMEMMRQLHAHTICFVFTQSVKACNWLMLVATYHVVFIHMY